MLLAIIKLKTKKIKSVRVSIEMEDKGLKQIGWWLNLTRDDHLQRLNTVDMRLVATCNHNGRKSFLKENSHPIVRQWCSSQRPSGHPGTHLSRFLAQKTIISSTVVCILVRTASYPRFWRNHSWCTKKWYLIWMGCFFSLDETIFFFFFLKK